jgi:hypothetical protein
MENGSEDHAALLEIKIAVLQFHRSAGPGAYQRCIGCGAPTLNFDVALSHAAVCARSGTPRQALTLASAAV